MAKPSLSEFADSINEIMPVIIKEFTRRHSNELYKGKITLPQFLILEFLRRQQECKMKELAGFMRVSTAAMTGIVERLVKYGYCVRQSDPQDRRIIKIRLTPKGGELLKKISGQRRKMAIDIFGQISEKDRGDYLRILMQVKDILTHEEEKIQSR